MHNLKPLSEEAHVEELTCVPARPQVWRSDLQRCKQFSQAHCPHELACCGPLALGRRVCCCCPDAGIDGGQGKADPPQLLVSGSTAVLPWCSVWYISGCNILCG